MCMFPFCVWYIRFSCTGLYAIVNISCYYQRFVIRKTANHGAVLLF